MVFGLGPVEIAAVVAVGCALEVVLLWAAAGLADAPDAPWPRLIGVGIGVFLACFAAACGIAHGFGVLQKPTAGETWTPLITTAALTLAATLVLPAAVYPPALSVSVRRGAWVSVVQWLLRLFLYIFVAALVMVVIAVVQIARGP